MGPFESDALRHCVFKVHFQTKWRPWQKISRAASNPVARDCNAFVWGNYLFEESQRKTTGNEVAYNLSAGLDAVSEKTHIRKIFQSSRLIW